MICDVALATIMAFSFSTNSWHKVVECLDESSMTVWHMDADDKGEEVDLYQALTKDRVYWIIDEEIDY